mmetsp:Transcript_18399/g.52564  ORF Transcript_18399/g.52564 Transcript_18399/m.52564 type:complete len:203 (-) Transcript_18399:52-660(-)
MSVGREESHRSRFNVTASHRCMIPSVHVVNAKHGRFAPPKDCGRANDVHKAFGAFAVGALQNGRRQVCKSNGSLGISLDECQQAQEGERQCCVLANAVFDSYADGLHHCNQPFHDATILHRAADDLAQQLHRQKVLGICHERHFQYILVLVAAEVRLDPYQFLDDRPDDASLWVNAERGLSGLDCRFDALRPLIFVGESHCL